MQYNFEWDPRKATSSSKKHGKKSSNMKRGNAMRDKYDFSKAERGKFFNPEAQHSLPLYLEDDVLSYFAAKAKGVELNALTNDLLKKDIELIEGVNNQKQYG